MLAEFARCALPRCALRLLSEHARADERARGALARIAWTGSTPIAGNLRASAAASLAAVASGAEAWHVAGHLHLERDPLVRDAAAEAMSRNPDPSAEAAFRSLGIRMAAPAHDRDDG
jgi:hypothetical protein